MKIVGLYILCDVMDEEKDFGIFILLHKQTRNGKEKRTSRSI